MKKTLVLIVLTILLASTLACAIRIYPAKAGTIIVPDDYPTIQEAINAANFGDTVYVTGGQVYYENVVVNKTITLMGENKENTVIDGNGIGDTVLVVADGVTISGFTVTNSNGEYPHAGLFFDNVKNSLIRDNNVSANSGHGIFLMWGSNNAVLGNILAHNGQPGIRIDGTGASATVANNTIEYNQQDGIFLYYAYDVLIENNTISNNIKSGISPQGGSYNITMRHNTISYNGNYGTASSWYHGIFVYYSDNTHIIENNMISNKGLGLYLNIANQNTVAGNKFINDGMVARDSYMNTVQNNTVNNKPLVYLEGKTGGTVGAAGQVVLVNCTNIQVKNLNLSNADVGVVMFLADNCTITGNTIANGYAGMRLYNSSRNLLSGNNITKNTYHGIYASYSCNNNTISGNNIIINEWFGIQWGSSSINNTFSENNISKNGQNGMNIHTFSSNNAVSGNNIRMNNGTGIVIGTLSDNNLLQGNTISGNGIHGINLYNSSYTTVSGNEITNNGNSSAAFRAGIELQAANHSSIFHNNFINNAINQAETDPDSYNNFWDDGYPSGGNYWNDYAGTDGNGDGIGDTPYTIDANNKDNYPFMNQSGWKNTKISFSLIPSPAYLDQTVTLLGNLTDRLGHPIKSAVISLYVNGSFAGNLSTNSSGWFQASSKISTSGTFNIRASYSGSSNYNPTSHTETLVVYAKQNTKVTFTLSPNPAKVGQTVTMLGNLTDAQNNTIANAPLDVYLKIGAGSWQYVATIYTSSTGWFSVSGKVTSKGTYQIAVLYKGSSKYNQSYDIETLTVNP